MPNISYAIFATTAIVHIFILRGYPENQKRYRKTMVLGYAFPTMVSIGTLAAEYLAPKCASLRPRFGEDGCFFAGCPLIYNLNACTYINNI